MLSLIGFQLQTVEGIQVSRSNIFDEYNPKEFSEEFDAITRKKADFIDAINIIKNNRKISLLIQEIYDSKGNERILFTEKELIYIDFYKYT